MSALFVVFPLIVVISLALVAFVSDRRRRHTRQRRRQTRERVHVRFSRFVHAVRNGSISEADIERFLIETTEVNALFYGGTLPRLRLELHDQALRLNRLEAALADWQGGPALRAVITEVCEEKRSWFAQIAGLIDTLFDETGIAPLERFNRAIGA